MSHNYKSVVKNLYRKPVLLLILFCAVSSCFAQVPTHSLVLWLRADSSVTTVGTDSVASWNDVSSSHANATSTPGNRPMRIPNVQLLNNKPSLLFNGTNDFLTGPAIAALNNQANITGEYIFMVEKSNGVPTSGATGIFVMGDQPTGFLWEYISGLGEAFVNFSQADPGNDYLNSTTAMPNSAYPYKLFGLRKKQGTKSYLDVNTVNVASKINTALDGTFTNGPYNLAWAGGTTKFLNGEIAEILVYDTMMTSTDITAVQNYLLNKYAPAANLGPNIVATSSLCTVPITPGNNYVTYHWSNNATANTINVGPGTYSVTTTDVFGFTSTSSITVSFPENLPAITPLCQNGSVTLTPNLGSLVNPTFLWSNGQTTSSITVNAGGNYLLTVTDVNHCSMVLDTAKVVVDAFASTLSLGPPASYCSGNRITLVTPATGWNNLAFQWSNGRVDSFTNVTTSGPYSVTVTDAGGCSGSASVSITIVGVAPTVNFSNDTVCQGLPFMPNNLSVGNNVTYVWNFGDGSPTSTLTSPSHLYATPGTYQVHLTGSNGGCSSDTAIAVVVNLLPAVAFQSGVVCTAFPAFNFTDLSVPVSGQTITAWSWDFGDGGPGAITQNPNHTYAATVDTYTVNLSVTQANGCIGKASNIFVVEGPQPTPGAPILRFPVDGSVASSDSVTFGWEAAAGAAYYKLEISTDQFLSTGVTIFLNIFSNQKTVQLQPNQTYYWQVTAYNPCGDRNLSLINKFTQFVPSNMPVNNNLALWLEADNGVVVTGPRDSVSTWNDQSGNSYNATSTVPYQPLQIPSVPLLNHKPSLKFNGVNDLLTGPTISGLDANSLSIFIVARADGAQINGEPAGIFAVGDVYCGMFIERNGSDGFELVNELHCNADPNYGQPTHDGLSMPPGVACPYHIYGIVKSVGQSVVIDTNSIFAKSNSRSEDVSPFSDNGPYTIANISGTDPFGNNAPYGFLNGEIAEIIIYNSKLTVPQQTLVNNYLFDKYAPPVNLGPDIVQNYKLCPITLKTGSRFISYLWSTGATSDTLVVTQSGTYAVTTVDVFNRMSADSIHVTLPFQGTNPETDYICYGGTGQITQIIGNPTAYHYIWSDSTSPSSVINLNRDTNIVNPTTAGYYYTRITDTTSAHCSFVTKKVPVIIDTFYNVRLLRATDTICKFGVELINVVPYTIDSFLWAPLAFPNDTMSAPTISVSGQYSLYAVDNHGCKRYDTTTITTRAQAPVVNFGVPNLCLTNTTFFIDSSRAALHDSIVSYFWNYGGGIPTTDTTVNGQTSYRTNYGYGNYTVSLTVTTDSGCFGVKTRHITILPAPNAGYADSANNSVYPYILCAGARSSLQLTDTSRAIGGSPIVERFWKFNGIVGADTGANIQYTFPNQGVYDITLEVVNAFGCADSITTRIDVNPPFVAQLSVDDHCFGDVTTFTDLTQSLSIVKRTWNFRENGEGPYAYSQVAQFQFNQPNIYDVELQIQNAIGCLSTIDTLIKIVQKPVANFTGLISCENHYYKPIDSSVTVNDVINQWSWNIDGHHFNTKTPRFLFRNTGDSNVSLIVKTQEGCADSITKTIQVDTVPTALFSYTPLYGTAPLLVTFNNRSINASSYIWNFGDGESDTTSVPQINPPPHIYAQNGSYNVELYAYNIYGCYDSFARTVQVIPTDLCLAIEQVQTYVTLQPDGSQLVMVVVDISNLGTRIITSANLYASLGNTNELEQNWSGYLLSGGTFRDTFTAQFVLPAGASNNYVCVKVSNINGGETEANCGSNQACVSLNGRMQLAGPTPNPAGANCQLGIILPQAGMVYITIYDLHGRPVIPEFSVNLPVGRTDYNIPVKQLEASEYIIRVRYDSDSQIRNLVVR